MYYYGPRWTRMFASDRLFWDRVAKDMLNCQRYGIEPGFQVYWGTDIGHVTKFMDIYRKHKWLGPLILGGGNLKMKIVARAMAKQAGKPLPPATEYYADAIRWAAELVRIVKTQKRPPIAFYVAAEAAQKGMPEMLGTKECLETIQAAVPDAKLMEFSISVEEVDVMATVKGLGMLSPNAACFSDENVEKSQELGWELWHYGWKRNRFRNGISDWRMGSRGGFAEWYGIIKRGPFNPFDSSGPGCWNDSPPFQGPDGPWPTVFQERMAAGRNDFLYLATLELTLADAEKVRPKAKEVVRARQWLDELRKRIYPHYTYYYRRMRAARKPNVPRETTERSITGYGPEQFDRFRRDAGGLISDLVRVTRKP